MYKTLFHENLTSTRTWNSVRILREVDAAIIDCERSNAPRAQMVASHLQRVILHLVFHSPELVGWESVKNISELLPTVRTLALVTFSRVADCTSKKNANEYLASVCKSAEKCGTIIQGVRDMDNPKQPELFEGLL
jgi:hypothetical protein